MNCIAKNCERKARTRRGHCLMHHHRWQRHGNVEVGAFVSAGTKCIAPGCPRKPVAKHYCGRHIQRIYNGMPLDETGSLPERFMQRVRRSAKGCWMWTGVVAGRYGQLRVFGKQVPAHRLAFELYVGAVPSSAFVCHRCDVPLCVRPDHLFLGTNQDNQIDRVIKLKKEISHGE